MNAGQSPADEERFAASRARFETVLGWLGGQDATGCEHGELQDRLAVEGRELLRQMLQDHLDVRAEQGTRLPG